MERKRRAWFLGWHEWYERPCKIERDFLIELIEALRNNEYEKHFPYEFVSLYGPYGNTYPRFPRSLLTAKVEHVSQNPPYPDVLGFRRDRPPKTIVVGSLEAIVTFFQEKRDNPPVDIYTVDQFPWLAI